MQKPTDTMLERWICNSIKGRVSVTVPIAIVTWPVYLSTGTTQGSHNRRGTSVAALGPSVFEEF